jgi:hypothetical protein
MTNILQAILAATLACGVLDAAAATTLAATNGIKPHRVWQTVASGLMGPRAYEAGWSSGILGLLLHFFISFVFATTYVLAGLRLHGLLQHPFVCGALYGIAIYLVMNYLVLPLSRRPKRPFNVKFAVAQLLIHIFIVGWSIALPVSYLLR